METEFLALRELSVQRNNEMNMYARKSRSQSFYVRDTFRIIPSNWLDDAREHVSGKRVNSFFLFSFNTKPTRKIKCQD